MAVNNNSIGIFDSGIGGLTIARAVFNELPNESIIYFGDTLHLPYGDKSSKNIIHFCDKISDFLLQKNCKAIVIACNTASAIAYKFLTQKITTIPVINVIDPIVNYITENDFKKVGIIATPATIKQATYQKKLKQQNPNIEITAKAAKSMASIIEEGWHNHPELISLVIKHYFSEQQFSNIETLVLGCTHYPVIHRQVQNFRLDVNVIDAPKIVALHLKSILQKNKLLNETNGSKKHQFYVSDLTEGFEQTAKTFFGADIDLNYYPLFND